MDAMGYCSDLVDFSAGIEESQLSRDVNILREVLASDGEMCDDLSDYPEDAGMEYCETVFDTPTYNCVDPQCLPSAETVLDKLWGCLEQNLLLQNSLQRLLDTVKHAIIDNQSKQNRLQMSKEPNPYRRSQSLISFRAKNCPYFVDHLIQAPTFTEDIINKLTREREYHLYCIPRNWNRSEVQRLCASVKQKNLQVMAQPVRSRTVPDSGQLACSPDACWDQIAYERFDFRRSAEDCYLHYKNHSRPGINHGPWSKEEERRLLGLVKNHRMREWEKTAAELGTNRTAISCCMHYQQSLNPGSYDSSWTKDQDRKLDVAVEIYGTNNWGLVANYIGGRTGGQCICRYANKTDCHKHKLGRWSKDEDERLVEAVKKFGDMGKVWQRVSLLVGTRNSVQCRERWRNIHIGSQLMRPWTEEDKQKLVDRAKRQLAEGRKISWSEIAKELNRRDDACLRRWKATAPVDQLLTQKTLQLKERLIRPQSVDVSSRRRSLLRTGDIGDDLLSEQHKEKLRNYKRNIVARHNRRVKKADGEGGEFLMIEEEEAGGDGSLAKDLQAQNKQAQNKKRKRKQSAKSKKVCKGLPNIEQGQTSQSGESRDEPGLEKFASQVKELSDGVYSKENLLRLQWLSQLNPYRAIYRHVRFAPPYPSSPIPFHACSSHRWPSMNQPPCNWPHPLFLCRPPHEYLLYM